MISHSIFKKDLIAPDSIISDKPFVEKERNELQDQIKAVTEQINISAKKIEDLTERKKQRRNQDSENQMRRESLIYHIERQKQKQEQYESELQKYFENTQSKTELQPKNSSPISINTKQIQIEEYHSKCSQKQRKTRDMRMQRASLKEEECLREIT